jgi:hypothetical protein
VLPASFIMTPGSDVPGFGLALGLYTRQRDALNAARRRLPMTEMDKEYMFEGRSGTACLLDLFETAASW